MYDRRKRAAAAVKLLKHCAEIDDQDATDLIVGIIDREQLYREYQTDTDQPITSTLQLAQELGIETEPEVAGTAPTASATNLY
jgi:hypothetical protein